MSDIKDFQRTMREAEQKIRDHLASFNAKESRSQIYTSCGYLEDSIEKIVDNLSPDTVKEFKEQIDNIYYHIGKIKGCL